MKEEELKIPDQSVLIIDDEENMRHMLASMLKRDGYVVQTAADGQEGLEKLKAGPFDFVLCDIKMPRMDGMDFLRAARAAAADSTIIMMSAYGTIDLAVEAMKLGAYDFISKPFKSDEVRMAIKKAAERDRLKRENLLLKEQIRRFEERHRFGNLVAKSAAMQKLFALAAKVAQYNTTVLIVGESGTGKELVAQAIHRSGPRQGMPMVPVNCGSIPESLLESELFGHVKGAFTGAERTKKGLFEEADGGTIFLDEIGEMPIALQVKLLRVLQENEIRPVGQSSSSKVDVRVIAATSRNLAQMVAEGSFREDLFYRLNVLTIDLPPLRERGEDIPLLCQHFIAQFNATLQRKVKGIAPAAMAQLLQHRWPGNVRELENVIERAMVLADDDWIKPESFSLGAGNPQKPGDAIFDGFSIKTAQKIMEKEMIVKALKFTHGNRTQAARLLEISHPSLLSKMKAYVIDL
ncbi:MAG: sigma-54-dependent Fis family transcriptional regulator [Desulfobacteraceae bacterium]|nr:MAG: sigma-54-dependent Fis family transcriptional regulator [Desulfobacteraceae bacterium]